jgi:hypothetical protein
VLAISARVRSPALQCHTDTRSIIEARNTRHHRISLAIRPVKAAIALATYSTCAHRLQMHLLTRAGSVAPKVSVRTHTIRRWCAWRIGLAWAGRQSILTDHCSCGRATRRGSPQLGVALLSIVEPLRKQAAQCGNTLCKVWSVCVAAAGRGAARDGAGAQTQSTCSSAKRSCSSAARGMARGCACARPAGVARTSASTASESSCSCRCACVPP